MEINSYSDLTNFCYEEYSKLTDNFGIQNPSKSFIKFNERSLKKYLKLYDKPFYKKAKRELQLQEALDTMPHGFLWKLIHSDLWKRIKYLEEQQKQHQEEFKTVYEDNKSTYYPSVVRGSSLPVTDEE